MRREHAICSHAHRVPSMASISISRTKGSQLDRPLIDAAGAHPTKSAGLNGVGAPV
jgi:hypothetical protein